MYRSEHVCQAERPWQAEGQQRAGRVCVPALSSSSLERLAHQKPYAISDHTGRARGARLTHGGDGLAASSSRPVLRGVSDQECASVAPAFHAFHMCI